jgi:hypothetical protein
MVVVPRVSYGSSGVLASAGAVEIVEQSQREEACGPPLAAARLGTVPCCAEPRRVMPERGTCACPVVTAVGAVATVVAAEDVALDEASAVDGVATARPARGRRGMAAGSLVFLRRSPQPYAAVSPVSGAARSRSPAWWLRDRDVACLGLSGALRSSAPAGPVFEAGQVVSFAAVRADRIHVLIRQRPQPTQAFLLGGLPATWSRSLAAAQYLTFSIAQTQPLYQNTNVYVLGIGNDLAVLRRNGSQARQ